MQQQPNVHSSCTETPMADATEVLLRSACAGNRAAVETVFARTLPRVRRWARGRLPASVRGGRDTCDLLQDVALRSIARLATFNLVHKGSLEAYLRTSLNNSICDEVRRAARRPRPTELSQDLKAKQPSPLDMCLARGDRQEWRRLLTCLKDTERRILVAHVVHGWSYGDIAKRFLFPSAPAARMAVHRAKQRLSALAKEKRR